MPAVDAPGMVTARQGGVAHRGRVGRVWRRHRHGHPGRGVFKAPRVAGARDHRHGGTCKWFCHRPQVDCSSAGGGSVVPQTILGRFAVTTPWCRKNATASERHPRRRFWGTMWGEAGRCGTSRANGAMVGSIFGGRVESGAGCPCCSRRAAPPTTQTRRGHQGAAQAEAVVATFGPGGAVEPNGWVRPRLLRQPDPEVFRSCG